MYPEFIAIYIGLGIITLMLAAVIVLLIILLKRNNTGSSVSGSNRTDGKPSAVISGDVVFCKKCATEYDITMRCCPTCKTPR